MTAKGISLWLAASMLLGQSAQALDVTVAYQTSAEPAKVAQADNSFARESGATVDWRKFDSGASVVRALASGDVQIGNIGSSPLAVAASQNLPIEVFLLASKLGESEALVVKQGLAKPEDLAGKRIAVPYTSTTHYSLLAALKHWGVDASKVNIVNLRPSEIAAAWQRGDIDAAYVWEPALGTAKASGKVLVSSAQVGKWGAPTYDLWIVRKDFAEKHPEFLTQFVKVTGAAYAKYNADPKGYAANNANVDKIARLTGAKPQDVALLLAGNTYPSLKRQAELLDKPFADAVGKTAEFLRAQGKVEQVQSSYLPYVTSRFVNAALK